MVIPATLGYAPATRQVEAQADPSRVATQAGGQRFFVKLVLFAALQGKRLSATSSKTTFKRYKNVSGSVTLVFYELPL